MFANQLSRLLLVAACLVASSMLANQAEGLPALSCIKEQILNRISTNLIGKSKLVAGYKQAVETAASRFKETVESESVKKMDDKEKENYFLKLVAEEVNKLKERNEKEKLEQGGEQGEILDEKTKECFEDESFNTDTWYHWDPEEMSELQDEDNEQLFSKLDGLEQEMGLALDEKTKELLKTRTKAVLTDILNNEARQIAMSVITAYFSGGLSTMVMAPFVGGLKFKLVEFLINAVIDVVSAVMDRRVEIKPADQLLAGQPIPAVA